MSLMEEDQEGMDKRVVVTDIMASTRGDDLDLDKEEQNKASKIDQAEELKKLKNQWSSIFIQEGGINFTVEMVLSMQTNQLNNARLKNIQFFISLSKVFITAALSANGDDNINSAVSLMRRQSSIKDEDAEESKVDTEKNNADSLVKLMQEGTTSIEVITSTKFDKLVEKLLEIISVMVACDSYTIEHKKIVEDALALVIASILNKPELLQILIDFDSKLVPDIKSGKDLILRGLLMCPEDKIRQDFKNSLNAVALILTKNPHNALAFVLNVLGENFSQIQGRPCAEFFSLFTKVMEQKSTLDELRS